MNIDEHQEFWARIFLHIQSPPCLSLFTKRLEMLISQISGLIETVGFWDVGIKNLPEVSTDGTYVCATDFENIQLDCSFTGEGLERLVHLFCIPLFAENLAKKYTAMIIDSQFNLKKTYYDQNVQFFGPTNAGAPPDRERLNISFKEELTNKQQASLALQKAMIAYDQRPSGAIGTFAEFDERGLDLAQIAMGKQLLKAFQNKWDNPYNTKSLTARRLLHIQPGCTYGNDYTRERFLGLLQVLSSQGIVLSWSDDNTPSLPEERRSPISFYIHF